MLTIRMYEERDFPALCALFLRAVKETASADYSPRQIAAWAQVDEARWRQKLAASRVLVAINDASPVGFITAVDDYIDLLFVSPDYSRQGVASALLNTLLRQLPERAYRVEASITAKPFFARHGFTVIQPQEVTARGERFLNYLMRRQIDPHTARDRYARMRLPQSARRAFARSFYKEKAHSLRSGPVLSYFAGMDFSSSVNSVQYWPTLSI